MLYKYILRRFIALIPVLIGITLTVFLIMHYAPGDPVTNMLGETYFDQETYEQWRHELGLDQPVLLQYVHWLSRVARGELGRSLIRKRPVLDLIMERLPQTLLLAGLATFFALSVAIPLGVVTAVYCNTWVDNIGRVLALLGLSMPAFWRGLILMLIFSWYLRIFPSGGSMAEKGPIAIVLPAMSLGIYLAAIVTRMTRSSLLDVLRQEYIITARAKGLAEVRILGKHALKNAMIPVVTVIGVQMGYLIGTGAILTETVFSWPGLGRLIVQAINERDIPLIQGVILCVAVIFVLIHLLIDLFYVYLDPRIEYK